MRHLEYAALNLINKKHKHVLEFGVCKGTSIKLLRSILDTEFEIFGFDTFDGLPEDWLSSKHNLIAGEGYCVKGCFTNDGVIPNIIGVKLYKGLFKDTIPEYKKVSEYITLLHVDCDLYSSTIDVLYELNDFIVEDTIIVFDEWTYTLTPTLRGDDHEQKAFYEWVEKFNREYEIIEYGDNNSEQKIIKIIK